MSSPAAARFLDRTTPPHLVTLVFMAALPALTMNVLLPSLPRMAADFGVTYAVMQLAISLYLVTNAVVQLFIGPVADRFGRRPVMLASMAVFLIGTLGALAAPSAGVFLAMRMLQAVAATAMVMSRAVVRDLYPPAQAASMIGYITMGMSIAPMVAPTLGGLLDQAFGWRASLWMLLAAGTVLTAILYFDQGETARPSRSSLAGQFRQYPVLLVSRRYWGYAFVATFGSGAFFAYLGGAPFVATEVFRLSPVQMGLGFAAPALGYAFGSFLSGRMSARAGLNRMMLAGSLVMCVGLGALAALELTGISHPAIFFGLIVSVGLGNGLQLPSANAGMLSVRPELAGTAAGLGGAITLGGGAAFASLAAALLVPGSGALTLVVIMLASVLVALLATLDLLRQDRPGF